jgi:hypothetical protein
MDVDGVRGHHEQQRVAVRRRAHDRVGGDVAAGAGAVLDHELLAEALRQPLPDHAGGCIGGTAGRKTENDAHGPRRIGWRPGNA